MVTNWCPPSCMPDMMSVTLLPVVLPSMRLLTSLANTRVNVALHFPRVSLQMMVVANMLLQEAAQDRDVLRGWVWAWRGRRVPPA